MVPGGKSADSLQVVVPGLWIVRSRALGEHLLGSQVVLTRAFVMIGEERGEP